MQAIGKENEAADVYDLVWQCGLLLLLLTLVLGFITLRAQEKSEYLDQKRMAEAVEVHMAAGTILQLMASDALRTSNPVTMQPLLRNKIEFILSSKLHADWRESRFGPNRPIEADEYPSTFDEMASWLTELRTRAAQKLYIGTEVLSRRSSAAIVARSPETIIWLAALSVAVFMVAFGVGTRIGLGARAKPRQSTGDAAGTAPTIPAVQ